MSWGILEVLPNDEKREQVENVLWKLGKEIGSIPQFRYVGNEAKARQELTEEAYDAVIASLDIPKDSKSIPEEGAWRGLLLAEWMKEQNMDIPVILFGVDPGDRVNERIDRLSGCEIINEKPGWEALLIKRAKNARRLARTTPQPKRLDVDICLNLENRIVAYSLHGEGFPCDSPYRPLDIVTRDFLELITESENFEKALKGEREWKSKLQGIGEKVMRHIFAGDEDFSPRFWTNVTKAGGLENVRIRFVIERGVHPLALEAIYGPDGQSAKDYWMLRAPIYRTVGEHTGVVNPLFYDEETREGPLNVLIIQSETEGNGKTADGWSVPLEVLTNVKTECEFLQHYLGSPEYSGPIKIGEVEKIPRPADTRPCVEQVKEALSPGKVWHIVHYAGHSYFDRDTNRGYLFFPHGRDEKGHPVNDTVSLEELSGWLRPVKPGLVFLSSCHSSEAGFVFDLAKNHIPAIVGFRWDVNDDMAADFTEVFYRELFRSQTQSLEYIFLQARRSMHDRCRDNTIWAAPILVMQIPPK